MKTRLFLAALSLLLFVSCNESTQTVKISNRYTLDVPAFLTETNNLNTDASLQYQNLLKEFYVIVIDEPKKAFNDVVVANKLEYTPNLKGYANLLKDGMSKKIQFDALPKLTDRTINGRSARIMDMSGKIDDIHAYWKIAFIEGKNRYYQVMTWTLADRKEDNEEMMEQIVNSFKETDKSKKRS